MINEKCIKRFCKEDISLIENYDKAIADKTQTWHCHHRAEILPCGRFSMNDLKKFNLYYARPANELIFLTAADHRRLHNKGKTLSEETCKKISESHKGKSPSEETRKKLSESHKGKTPWNKGKHCCYSDEYRKKISNNTKLAMQNPEIKKKISESHKGKSPSEETRKKMSESRKGKKRGPYKKKNQEN